MAEQRSSLELFKVAGVQVEIDYSWIIIALLVLWSLSAGYFPGTYPGHPILSYWIVGAAGTVLFFASVLGHELSHAAVGNRLGENIDRITLFIFGGMAHLSGEPRTAVDELKIAGVGPLSSVVIAAIFWVISRFVAAAGGGATLWVALFRYLAFINVALAVFNLLPGFPLDGGRLLRAYLWYRWGDLRRATARAADWGSGIAWTLMIMGALEIFGGGLVGGLWLIFIGLFLRAAASSGYQSLLIEQMLSQTRVRDLTIRDPVAIAPELSINEAIERYFLHHGFTGYPVIGDGRALGMLSLSRVRECPPQERATRRVSDLMVPLESNLRIAADAPVSAAMHQMADADAGRLVVMDGGRMLGIITRSAIARFVQMKMQFTAGENVSV
jgi:Zn-dependent protease